MSPALGAIIREVAQPADSKARSSEVFLQIERVPKPESPSTALRVFLNCKDPSLKTPTDDPTYAGTLAFSLEARVMAATAVSPVFS